MPPIIVYRKNIGKFELADSTNKERAMFPVLNLKNVWVCYNRFFALKQISLTIEKGIIGLLGPNGAGKTTLIKSLLGLLPLSKGEIEVMGFNVKQFPLEVRRRIGYVPEGEAYLPGVSAVKFVAFAAELTGLDQKAALKRAHEVLEYVGLGEERYRKIEELSPGQQVRTKLAQALCHNVELLILDEPIEGLDPLGRENFLTLIKNIRQTSPTNILFSTHTLEDAETLCDQVIFLHAGQILAVKALSEIMIPEPGTYVIQITENLETFLSVCNQNQVKAEVYQENKVFLRNVSNPKIIFNLASQGKTVIQQLFPWKPKLEEIFLKILHSHLVCQPSHPI